MADPYLYFGSDVLRNLRGIRDRDTLQSFENAAVAQRMAEGLPSVTADTHGYRRLHHHLFQDVYDWAGQIRCAEISKPGALFCRVEYIERELSKRFAHIQKEIGLSASSAALFVSSAAKHLSELNAIHPFREGNGRTLRAFLQVFGDMTGHPMAIEHIDPNLWVEASKQSFTSGRTDLFCEIIARCRASEKN